MKPSNDSTSLTPSPWKNLWSIRVRTAIILYIVFVCIVLSVSLGLRGYLRQAFEGQLDARLTGIVDDISQSLKKNNYQIDLGLKQEWELLESLSQMKNAFFRIQDNHNQIVWQSKTAPKSIGIETAFAPRNAPYTAQNFRVLETRLSAPNNQQWAVESGISLESLNASLSELDLAIFWYTLLIVVVLPLAAWWLARVFQRPLTRIAFQAEKLSASEFADYLAENGTGDDVDRLSNTINSLLRRSRQELRIREDWLANSAHHLRGPLAAISANVEVVASRLQSDSSKIMLQNVLADCKLLTKLVNQLLLLAEAEADSDVLRGKRKPADLKRIVRNACSMFERLAANKEIAIEILESDDCWVFGNGNLLSQVIYNLLDNAIKFTPANGVISIQTKCVEDRNECQVIIADTGAGIPEEELPKITERFFCGKATKSKSSTFRSTGLGLSICDAIVARHEGKLNFESISGVGTTVTITLPRIPTPAPGHAPPDSN
jgi:signal transduction histidine kinase